MFRDAKEELKRLEQELLAQENEAQYPEEDYEDYGEAEFEEENASSRRDSFFDFDAHEENWAGEGYDDEYLDEEEEAYVDRVYEGRTGRSQGVLIAVLVMLTCILASLVLWAVKHI